MGLLSNLITNLHSHWFCTTQQNGINVEWTFLNEGNMWNDNGALWSWIKAYPTFYQNITLWLSLLLERNNLFVPLPESKTILIQLPHKYSGNETNIEWWWGKGKGFLNFHIHGCKGNLYVVRTFRWEMNSKVIHNQ